MESTVLTKTFGLLEAMAVADVAPGGTPLAALAASAGVAKPSAHRILKTLVALGYVQRHGTGVYRPAAKLRRLAGQDGASRDAALIAAAEAPLEALHAQCAETLNLAVLRGGRVHYLRVIESPHALRWASNPEVSDPFHCTALGRAIVAHLPGEEQAALLRNGGAPLARPTPRTVTDTKRLARILEQARHDGFAVEREQSVIGGMCVAAPILGAERQPLAAISITLPIARVRSVGEAKLARLACRAARQIAERMLPDQTH